MVRQLASVMWREATPRRALGDDQEMDWEVSGARVSVYSCHLAGGERNDTAVVEICGAVHRHYPDLQPTRMPSLARAVLASQHVRPPSFPQEITPVGKANEGRA
jgi:hypothetical protein